MNAFSAGGKKQKNPTEVSSERSFEPKQTYTEQA